MAISRISAKWLALVGSLMPSNDSVKFEGCYGDNDCYKGGDVIYLMNSSCHGIHVFVPSRAISKTLFTKLALLQLYCRG